MRNRQQLAHRHLVTTRSQSSRVITTTASIHRLNCRKHRHRSPQWSRINRSLSRSLSWPCSSKKNWTSKQIVPWTWIEVISDKRSSTRWIKTSSSTRSTRFCSDHKLSKMMIRLKKWETIFWIELAMKYNQWKRVWIKFHRDRSKDTMVGGRRFYAMCRRSRMTRSSYGIRCSRSWKSRRPTRWLELARLFPCAPRNWAAPWVLCRIWAESKVGMCLSGFCRRLSNKNCTWATNLAQSSTK